MHGMEFVFDTWLGMPVWVWLTFVAVVMPQQVRFLVKDGSVEVEGVVTSEDQRLALHALAEGVAGVKHVIDRLRITTGLTANPA